MGDNRVFNVNGSGVDMLQSTLELVFKQSGMKCAGWTQTVKHGLILLWHADTKDAGIHPFPTDKGMSGADMVPMVVNWLNGDFAKTVVCKGWDEDADHDGHNSTGWRVYCEDWGHVADNHYAICAIKPAFIWHGK